MAQCPSTPIATRRAQRHASHPYTTDSRSPIPEESREDSDELNPVPKHPFSRRSVSFRLSNSPDTSTPKFAGYMRSIDGDMSSTSHTDLDSPSPTLKARAQSHFRPTHLLNRAEEEVALGMREKENHVLASPLVPTLRATGATPESCSAVQSSWTSECLTIPIEEYQLEDDDAADILPISNSPCRFSDLFFLFPSHQLSSPRTSSASYSTIESCDCGDCARPRSASRTESVASNSTYTGYAADIDTSPAPVFAPQAHSASRALTEFCASATTQQPVTTHCTSASPSPFKRSSSLLPSAPRLPLELQRLIMEIRARQTPRHIPRLMLVAYRFRAWLEPLLYRHLILPTYEKVKRILRCCDQTGLGDKLASLVETLTMREIDGLSADAVRLLGICSGATRLRLSMGMEKNWILEVGRLPRLQEVTLHCAWNSLPSMELVERLLELWAGVVVTVELSHRGPTNSSSFLQGLDPRIMVVHTDSLPPRLRADDPAPRRPVPPRPVRRF